MGNCNTTEYWNGVWVKWRHDDRPNYIQAQVTKSLTKEYWDNAFKNPSKLAKYSVQRAWWYAKEIKAQSVLDVGCGNGRLLYGMSFVNPFMDSLGVDFSQTAIDRMKKDYGVEGKVMDVFDIDKIERNFDMVVVNDVLEHVEDEKLFLEKCLGKLKDDGIFYLSLPNNYLGPEDTDEHLRKYTKESTISLLESLPCTYSLELIDIHILCIVRKAKTT